MYSTTDINLTHTYTTALFPLQIVSFTHPAPAAPSQCLGLTFRSRHRGARLGAHQYQPFRDLLREYRSRRPGFQKKRLSSIDQVKRAGRDTMTSPSSFLSPFFSSDVSLSRCLMVWVSSGQLARLKQSMSQSICFLFSGLDRRSDRECKHGKPNPDEKSEKSNTRPV